MGRHPSWRTALIATVAVALAVLVLPAVAGAVIPGFNGRIVFLSGRGEASDGTAKIYLRTIDSGTGGGSASGAVVSTGGIQHRHPVWSPDRTKIAYAAGVVNTDYDIFVLDITVPGAVPENITETANISEDRPAWAPDGEHIAYESEVSAASGQTDVLVESYPTSGVSPLFLTSTSGAGQFEGKPEYTPDSQEILYVVGDINGTDNAAGIVKKAANGASSVTTVLNDPTVTEFQPSLSPDGSKMCYTRGPRVGAADDVYITDLDGSGVATGTPYDLSDNTAAVPAAANGDYNCTWSPDGLFVAYVMGTFTNGDLVMERADDTAGPLPLESTGARFDGNPNWAPDGTPECEPATVSTKVGAPVDITLDCNDTGPAYEQTAVTETISDPPDHGTLGSIQQGDPSTVEYTPDPGFSGTDTFTLGGFDFRQFATPATITIKVDANKPVISKLKVNPSTWARGSGLPTFGTAAVKVGTKISFNLSEDAEVTLKFARQRPGRRVGGKCVKPTSGNKGKPSCKRYKGEGRLVFDGQGGKNSVKFKGRLSSTKRLPLGRYRMRASAVDAAGQASATKTKNFRIVKKP